MINELHLERSAERSSRYDITWLVRFSGERLVHSILLLHATETRSNTTSVRVDFNLSDRGTSLILPVSANRLYFRRHVVLPVEKFDVHKKKVLPNWLQLLI